MENKPKRICFNFLDVCNMNCPFCYLDFRGVTTDLQMWLEIVDRVIEWGSIESITVGGGDPLAYRDIGEFLSYCKQKKLFVQVDTNGLSFRDKHVQIISDFVDLLGISLDGHTQEVAYRMRGDRQHFSKVISILEKRNIIESTIKINTIVGKPNVNSLEELGNVIEVFKPDIWSLYQFWPIGTSAKMNTEQYIISKETFDQAIDNLEKKKFSFDLEVSPYDKRHKAYFFVDQTGHAYTVDRYNVHNYIPLGSVFDADIINRWAKHSNSTENFMRITPRIKKSGNKGSS